MLSLLAGPRQSSVESARQQMTLWSAINPMIEQVSCLSVAVAIGEGERSAALAGTVRRALNV